MGWSDDYLEHHGILGQKWGVRRFENKNGTLTPAGRKRYSTDENGDYKKVGGPGKVTLPNSKSLNRLADETQKDADISRKSGYEAEAKSLQKKADDLRSKAKEKEIEEANRRKKIIIAGAAIAGTALAAYGGYKLYQLNEKAKEGMSKEYHKKAVDNRVASNKLDTLGFDMHDQGFKTARESGADSGNRLMDIGKSYMDEASLHRDLADQYDFKANSKKYSVKEKYNYLKTGKVEDSALSKLTKSQIEDEHSRRSGIEKKYAEQRRQQELEAQKAFRAAQNTAKKAEQAGAKDTRKTTPSMEELSRAQSVLKNGRQSTSKVVNINGQQKFNQAVKANDDLVQELLKKNAKSLGL